MTSAGQDPSQEQISSFDFIAGPDGPVIPDPDQTTDSEYLARTQTAMELFRGNIERLEHFKRRVDELGLSGNDAVITLINVDDPNGSILANVLMPEHDWQRYRDAGEIPVARGLAKKDGVHGFLMAAGYNNAADELASTSDIRVVVLDAGVALVMDVNFPE